MSLRSSAIRAAPRSAFAGETSSPVQPEPLSLHMKWRG